MTAHTHNHTGHAQVAGQERTLAFASALTLGFAGVEAVAGWWSGSLALLGDAGHMVTDSVALLIATVAAWLARRPPSTRHSYGLGRAQLLAAAANALFMLAVVALLVVHAVERLQQPVAVKGEAVTLVALLGLALNLLVAWLLTRGERDLNVRAALLHVLGDLLGSVAAFASGVVIVLTGWTPIDPALTLVIAVLIAVSSLKLAREALHALMEGVPLHLSLPEVGRTMAAVEGVVSVHDLHIWSLSAARVALSAHVVVRQLDDWDTVLARLRHLLHERYDIDHVTLQPEPLARPMSRARRRPTTNAP
jgi:cobalt-zinc-cadmium efflux system protein